MKGMHSSACIQPVEGKPNEGANNRMKALIFLPPPITTTFLHATMKKG